MSQLSRSSDYFSDYDEDFLAALDQATLPGDVTRANDVSEAHDKEEELSRKRPRSPDSEEDSGSRKRMALVGDNHQTSAYLNSNTYGEAHFGDFGEYMHRKRAKLQLQNAEISTEGDEPDTKSHLFSGLEIYINGWTEPSVQVLRELIVQHGGIYHAYLDKKSLVTHILTCSLTPAKVKEFQYMKVVRPDWLVKSAEQGILLPWHEFIFKPGDRLERSQGKTVAQKSLLGQFASQAPSSSLKKSQSHASTSSARVPTATMAGTARIANHLPEALTAGPSTPPGTPKKRTPNQGSPGRLVPPTEPSTSEQADRVPSYAADKSNVAAQRAMADPAWRAAHTSAAPDFIEGYYRNSRLHHLSTWKAELRNLVAEAQEKAENGADRSDKPSATVYSDSGAISKVMQENMNGNGWRSENVSMKGAQLVKKGKEKATDVEGERVIMHCDFDSFFVSAGLVDRPHLRGKPTVVCHSQGAQGGQSSTSEIASASYEAREFGIKGGMSLQQARKLCPSIATIPYEFQRYKELSLKFYTILMAHADDLQAVSVDEALIDVTTSVRRIESEISCSPDPSSSPTDPAKEFADAIRAQVRNATGCEVSIGISCNIMLSRLASRKAKPAGSFHLRQANVHEFLAPLDIDKLHGFGHSARQKAEDKLGTTNLGELALKSKALLCEALGKSMGETLYKALRGRDERKIESDKPRRSVSCDINYGIRFENNEQAEAFVLQLAEEVARRLKEIDMVGRSLTLKIMKRDPTAPVEAPKFMGHGICDTFNKQSQLLAPGGRATRDGKVIGEHAWRLLKSFNFDPKELRGIAIQVQKLEKSSGPAVVSGQGALPFKPVTILQKTVSGGKEPASKPSIPAIVVRPSSQEDLIAPQRTHSDQGHLELPSFSQVDMSVFAELPPEIREELEAEYKRRSAPPEAVPVPVQAPARARAASDTHKFKVPALPNKRPNVKHITRQLVPKSRSSISPTKSKLFTMQASQPVKVSQAELTKLNVDPTVFNALPPALQREQLAYARQASVPGGPGAAFGGQKKKLKPVSRARVTEGNVIIPPPPPPKAKYLVPPTLKQPGKKKGEKLFFSETDDVQCVIETWVDSFREHPPNQRDVEFFARFLVQCVDGTRSSDGGVERAVAVVKWWRVLLRRHFPTWEDTDDDWELDIRAKITSEGVGRAWWAAFHQVKEQMDLVARRKFGGRLSLS